MRVIVQVTTTISRGRVVWENGKLNVKQNSGRFIPMQAFNTMYEGLDLIDSKRMKPYDPTPVPRSSDAKDEL